jgi:putative transposase
MRLDLDVTEARELINLLGKQESFLDALRLDINEAVGDFLSKLMGGELTEFLGREPYERLEATANHRNGFYERRLTLKGIGEVRLKVPRDRLGLFQTQVVEKGQRYEKALVDDLSLLFLSGCSTRSLSLISKRLLGRKISATEISNASTELTEAVEKWRLRDLSQERIKYLYLDGVNFRMRLSSGISLVPILVIIGVAENGQKLVLGLQAGDKESATSWREFFKDLKARGLDKDLVQLGIMDGLKGLESVFVDEFPKAEVQRCQVHVARNVLCKVPQKLKKAVADDVRSIFYATSKKKAMEFFVAFKERWEPDCPSAVKSLETNLESCLTYLQFPQEEWLSLRTTNLIERLNKEFKRRTKPMEIVPGEESCYRLLAFICLKMELHWRSNPVGKVKESLPFFKKLRDL